MMTHDADNGLERWCYDAIRQREWSWGSSNVVLRRCADLVWMHFDTNPAYFCTNVLAVQPIEAFLSDGAPVAAPDDVVSALRDHLLAVRTPGSTTWLAIGVSLHGAADCSLISADLRQDGVSLASVPIPGPAAAGLYDWPPPGPRAQSLRLLVPPGPSVVTVEVSVNGPSGNVTTVNRIEHAAVAIAIVTAPQGRTDVRVIVDATSWPTLTLHQVRDPN
jgi:hypothetical protein